ncbi:hypothetical protein [Endozoicomonas atrinae]|uniref:hypothetical protein n=1 Tax=Endozoicomonas atrinae TaxID=1333660 RepID=UPI003B005DF5
MIAQLIAKQSHHSVLGCPFGFGYCARASHGVLLDAMQKNRQIIGKRAAGDQRVENEAKRGGRYH